MNKPNGITIINKNNFYSLIWPLPTNKMYSVGNSITKFLNRIGIWTIKDLACFKDLKLLENNLGKQWYIIYQYANGFGDDYINSEIENKKSLSISHTLVNDTNNLIEIEKILQDLCKTLATKLQKANLKGTTINFIYKYHYNKLFIKSKSITTPINSYEQIYKYIMILLDQVYNTKCFHLLGVGISKLITKNKYYQISIFDDNFNNTKNQLLKLIDKINNQLGKNLIFLAENKLR